MNENAIEILLSKSASSFEGAELFGYASTKKNLREVIQLLKSSWDDDARCAAAAYGMLLVASTFTDGPYRKDALNALDQLSLAKVLLDSTACHLLPVINVTAEILFAAQKFADEATIPCTEWPSVHEIAVVVLGKAKCYSKTSAWVLSKYSDQGAIIGKYIANFPE
jgi:hypothetical protein